MHIGEKKLKLAIGCGSYLESSTTLVNGQWYHVAASIDASGFSRIYLNGEEVGSGNPRDGVSVTGGNDLLGIHWSGGTLMTSKSFNGQIDEVRIWSKVRTQSEIVAKKDNTLTGNETGLIAYWNFDDGTSNDKTTNNNHGVLKGDAKIE